MPRQARLDAPGVLDHVMVRGIERLVLFRDDGDCADFVSRLAALLPATGPTVYAWALLPNHAHLLVRTGRRLVQRAMRPCSRATPGRSTAAISAGAIACRIGPR